MLRFLFAIVVLVFGLVGFVSSATGSPIDNTTITYDTTGQRIDAHDGDLLQSTDGTIYMYGTSYACGFTLNTPSPYCGVKIYASTDLSSWTPVGSYDNKFAFDPNTVGWQNVCAPPTNFGCFRPHVVKRPSDGKYVMWINTGGTNGYKILVSDYPIGPFVDTEIVPNLGVKPPIEGKNLRYGDEDITVSSDGTGYLSYTVIWPNNKHDIIIERLDSTLTTGTGFYVFLGHAMVESPALFQSPTGMWQVVYSDPAKPYSPTNTSIMDATNPMGSWSNPRNLVGGNSCSGQPSGVWPIFIGKHTIWVYGSDRWSPGLGNQTNSNNYLGSLAFNANNGTAIDFLNCQSFWTP